MIGLALAPTVVAVLTQYVFGAESMLRYSIATMPHRARTARDAHLLARPEAVRESVRRAARAWH